MLSLPAVQTVCFGLTVCSQATGIATSGSSLCLAVWLMLLGDVTQQTAQLKETL
jgi:hypothetical protein